MARAVSFGGISPPKHRPRRLQKIKSVPITRGGGHTGEVKGKGWITATPPPNNKERIEKLKSYNVLDTPPEVSYDAITNIAAALCGAPMAAISLVDDTRQFFKSRFGIDATGTPIDQSFCSHTIVDVSGFMEVRDATKDERFYGNPLVAGDFALRFYAGAALITPDDHALGALCVLDKKPRQLDKYQTDALKALSRLVVDQLESRAHNLQLIELSNKLKESQKKLEEANAELMAQNSVLKKQIKELGNKQAEIELNAPVAKVVDLLSNIHSHIHDRQQKVLLQDAIKIIASNKLYEVDVEEAISAGTNVDNETKGFLLTQLDSPTGQKPDNLRGSGFLDGASADVADDVSTDDVNSGTSTVNSSSDDVNKGSEGVNKSSGSVTPTTMPVVRSKDFTRKFSIVPKTPDASIEIAKIDAVIGSVKDLTTNIEDWDFDVFKFSDTCKQPLFYSTLALLHKNDFFYKLPIPAAKLISFLTEVEKGYIHSNQYHNNVHAMDVMLSSHHIAKASGILQYITPSEHLALLLAAAVHDLGHLGVNNAFLIQTAHDIAIAHNDKSVLENYHCVQAFKLLYNTNNDFLENFSFVERQEIRKNMIELILATDMSHHVEIFNTFQNKRTTKEGLDVANNKQDRLLVLKMIIKCADISNSAKKNSFYLNWASRVMEEFWSQGDQERKLGMPVSAFMDRTQQDVPKCQTGFIQFIALPFYTAMLEQFPGLAHCVESMQENLNYWKNKQ